MKRTIGLMGLMGLHPAAAIGVAAVDNLLFASEVATIGSTWVVSVPVGIALGIAVGLIQHRGPLQDDIGFAAGKGILVAILTAIPTSIGSGAMVPTGIAGAVTMVRNRRRDRGAAHRSDGDSSD